MGEKQHRLQKCVWLGKFVICPIRRWKELAMSLFQMSWTGQAWRIGERVLNWKVFKIMNIEMPQYLQSLIPEKIGTKRPQYNAS